MAKPGVRYSTRLLDMMPENTVLYAALPNLSATIVESQPHHRRADSAEPGAQAIGSRTVASRRPGMNHAIATIQEFGDQLGEEIAVGAGMDDKGEPVAPLVLAELKNPAGFRAFFDAEVQKLDRPGQDARKFSGSTIRERPRHATTPNSARKRQTYLCVDQWRCPGRLSETRSVAARSLAQTESVSLRQPFHNRIAEVYREGAGLVVAADLEKIIAQTRPACSRIDAAISTKRL